MGEMNQDNEEHDMIDGRISASAALAAKSRKLAQ
jgi:hypothetical protein